MIVAGIDCGAKNTKVVVMKTGQILGKGLVSTASGPEEAAKKALDRALANAGVKPRIVDYSSATGSGKESIPFADTRVDDIQAISRGARYFFLAAHTVVDVGAEEGRASRLDENGNAIDFVVNEKCAAGAGLFIEVVARILGVPIEEIGPLSLQSKRQVPINAQCAVFAEFEVIKLIHANASKSDIGKAIHDAVANRIVSMIRRIGVLEDLVMLGGLARNLGVVTAIKRELNLGQIAIPEDPEFGAAVGAAVVAAEEG